MKSTAIYMKRSSFFNRNKDELLFKYAAEHNLTIVKVYTDKPMGKINRAKMILHSRGTSFDTVLVYRLTDLDPDPRIQDKIIRILRQNGIMVISVKDSLTVEDMGNITGTPCLIN